MSNPDNDKIAAIVKSSTVDELEKRVKIPPSNFISDANYSLDMAALVFYTLIKSTRRIILKYEVGNDNHFLRMYKRYRDKLRRMVYSNIAEVQITCHQHFACQV